MITKQEIYDTAESINLEGQVSMTEVNDVAELVKLYDNGNKILEKEIVKPEAMSFNGQTFQCVNVSAKNVEIVNPNSGKKEIIDNSKLVADSINADIADTLIKSNLTDSQKREGILGLCGGEAVSVNNDEIDDDFTPNNDGFVYSDDDDDFDEN